MTTNQSTNLSETTEEKIDQLASDVESIPDLGFLGGSILYSRHYSETLPFEWVARLNEIIDESDTHRSSIIDYFMDQVDLDKETDFESAILPAIIAETAAIFHAGTETQGGNTLPTDGLDADQVVVVDGQIKRVEALEADDRGRIHLGPDNANETLRVAVLETIESDEE